MIANFRLLGRWLVPAMLMLVSGCALHYVDADGDQHYLGFVSMKTQQQGCLHQISTTTAGLTLDVTKESGGLNLGVRSISKIYLHPDTEMVVENDGKQIIEYSHKSSDNSKKLGC